MTINCNQLDDLLLEGDPDSMQLAAQHAETCDACMQSLASWNEISATAQELHATWNSDLLWPRIERGIRAERQLTRPRVWQIAAAVVLLAALAAAAFIAQRRMRAAEFDNNILRASAVDEVERAEEAHVAAINHLETLAGPRLEQPSTPLLVSYHEKLLMLDDAIAECQSAIDRNQKNAYLRRQLLTMYSEKQRTLQDVLREETHERNQ
jgi:hypothetical protein